jgi:hypothetical protein
MPSIDHEIIKALHILPGCEHATADTLAAPGVSGACLDAQVAHGVVRMCIRKI